MSRSRIGRSAHALALVLVVALAALGALAWFVGRGARSAAGPRAPRPQVELPAEARGDVSAVEAGIEAGRAGSDATDPTQASATPTSAPATLRIRVLDASTRAPLPDLGFVVYRERGGTKTLAEGRTDADGRAEVGGLEENTILVRTARSPPHAEQTAALWLRAGRTQELEILAGPGSALTGRVVDERKLPVAGALLFLDPENETPEPGRSDARSGADGRFRIECAASRPQSVWIVDGEMRPEQWRGAELVATLDGVHAVASAEVVPGQDTDFGDLVLARAATYAGRVVDARGTPVVGALFSPHVQRQWPQAFGFGVRDRPQLRIPFGDRAFELLEREQLTDAAGRFELRGNPHGLQVLVQTLDGQSQVFDLPETEPNARKEGLEFRLDPATMLELELVDAHGALVRQPASATGTQGLWSTWRSGMVYRSGGLRVSARAESGARIHGRAANCGADGVWRVQLRTEPGLVDELQIALAGYEPVVDRVAGQLGARARRRYVLAEFPLFHVRLSAQDPRAKPPEPPGVSIQLHVCQAPPARHDGASQIGGCCGFGVFWSGYWRGETRVFDLPVRRREPFWIYARGQLAHGEFRDVAAIGPFEPGEELRELALDPASLPPVAQTDQEPRKAPEPRAPGEDHFARVSARIVDARTGEGVPGALLQFVGLVAGKSRGSTADADEHGEVKDARVDSGTWTIRALSSGHRRAEVGQRELAQGERVDLGTIALAAELEHKGRILAADGSPVAGAFVLVVAHPPQGETEPRSAETAADGGFTLFGELSPRMCLTVGRRVPSNALPRYESQRFVLEPWPAEEVRELRCQATRSVVVTILGLDPEATALVPCVCAAPGEALAVCDHRAPGNPAHNPLGRGYELGEHGPPACYGFLLVPGRYQLWGSNLLHELPVTEFEVPEGEGELELSITAH